MDNQSVIQAPPKSRIEKTHDKIRDGGLPVPTTARSAFESGNGRPCAGCSETITQFERMATVIASVALRRLHEECFTAWATFSE
jgi:hypothetical protein